MPMVAVPEFIWGEAAVPLTLVDSPVVLSEPLPVATTLDPDGWTLMIMAAWAAELPVNAATATRDHKAP